MHVGNKTSYITFTSFPEVWFIVNSENFDKFVYPVTEMSPILNFRKEEGFLIFDKFFIDQHAQIYSFYSDECQRRGLLVGERRVTIVRDAVSVNRGSLIPKDDPKVTK